MDKVISAFIIWAAGSLQSTINDLASHAEVPVTRALLTIVYFVLPKLENFDFRHEVSNFVPISYVAAWNPLVQGLGYVAVVMILASVFFNDRQV